MAIYHFHAQRLSRGRGASAVAAAAYRHRGVMREDETGELKSYTGHKEELVHSEIALPDQTPAWLRTLIDGHTPARASEALWNRVQRDARRANAVFAKEIVMGLPAEFSREQNVALMRSYVRDAFTSRGMVADWVIHEKAGNPHAHVMLTARPLTESGFGTNFTPLLDAAGEPLRRLNGKIMYEAWNSGPGVIHEWRQTWARIANLHLEQAGLNARIDHRSLADRGSDLEPDIHLGPHAAGVQARSGEGTVERERERIRRENAERIRANPAELIVLAAGQAAVFSRADLERVARRYFKGEERSEIESLVDRALSSPELSATASHAMDRRSGRMVETTVYATRAMIDLERRMVDQARALRLDLSHGLDRVHVQAALAAQDAAIRQATGGRSGLSDEQREAVLHVTDTRGIALVVGYAGSGKSTMLQAANAAWSAAGRRVFGAALAGKAAEGLRDSSGIQSRTLASWQYGWSQGRDTLQKGDVFVIDEAGMVSSGQLARVIDAIHGAGAKAVLVGDAMQLQPIQAGAAFRAISERIGFVELEGIRRQRAHEWQREASLDLARGRTSEALQAYQARGSVRFYDKAESAHRQIVADWQHANRQGSVLILSHANKDVDALNAGVRAARKEAGELAGTEVQFQTSRGLKGFTVGDRVLFLKNEMDVKNGMLGTVEGLGLDTLTVRTDRGDVVALKPSEYEHFSHGYAATIHKAQGATVDRTLVFASDMMDRHLAYVAMTRHRDDAVLYAATEAFPTFEDLALKLGRDGSSSTTLDHDFVRRRVSVAEPFSPSEPASIRPERSADREQEGGRNSLDAAAPLRQMDDAVGINRAREADHGAQEAVTPAPDANRPPIGAATPQVSVDPGASRPAPHEAKAVMVRATPASVSEEPSIADRVAADPAYHRAREAFRAATTAVWVNPEPVVSGIEARLRTGESLDALTAQIREYPEQFGALLGREGRSGPISGLLPEGAAARTGRIERAAAREDAAFAAAQASRAGEVWRERVEEETAQAAQRAGRAERMGHAVPFLSDRAQGLVRAFSEAVEAGPDAARLAAARAHDRPELAQELLAFDAALTRRFGADAFTERATEAFEDSLGARNQWAAALLRVIGPQVRRFAAGQAEVEARLAQAPSASREERTRTPPIPEVEPLFPAHTVFDVTPETAAREAVMQNGDLAREMDRLLGAARIVFRDPDRAVKMVLEALPDGQAFDRLVNPLFDSPAAFTAVLGDLTGSKKLFAPRADKQARVAAEQAAKAFLVAARDLRDAYAGAVRIALQVEQEARAAAAIPVPALSEEAMRALDQLQGATLDTITGQYGRIAVSPAARREIEAFGSAVERKFGFTLSAERIAPRPTAAQRATFARERTRLETARTLARGLALQRDKARDLDRGRQSTHDRGR